MRGLWLIALGACAHRSVPDEVADAAPPSPDAPVFDAPVSEPDLDGDGLADAYELQLAIDYMPYVSVAQDDGCALDGMLVRVRPHPANPALILVVYDHLFERDCGLGGHVGDDEVFGIAIDPHVAPPAGILAIRAVSHQNTPCERDTQCATCANDTRPACDLAAGTPVVYASKGKHGQYATLAQCPLIGTCLDECTLAAQRAMPPVVNAGEPGHPLTSDLTAHGFITPANGWTEPSLMHFDPWDATKDFGGAGSIANDLQDPAFVAAPCS